MRDNLEIELKLEFAAGAEATAIELTRADRSPCATSDIVTTYFDTPNLALRDAGFTVRIRSQDGQLVQTVKSQSATTGLFQRREWETSLNDYNLDHGALSEVLGDQVDHRILSHIAPAFGTRFHRIKQKVETEQSCIERVVDIGEITTGNAVSPITEIELELLYGSKASIFDLARSMNRALPLRVGFHSKADRGYRLLQRDASHRVPESPAEWTTGRGAIGHLRSSIASAIHEIRTLETEFTDLGNQVTIIRIAELLKELSQHARSWNVSANSKEGALNISGEARCFASTLQENRSMLTLDTWQFRDFMLRVIELLEFESE